jgi:hypothetical protein
MKPYLTSKTFDNETDAAIFMMGYEMGLAPAIAIMIDQEDPRTVLIDVHGEKAMNAYKAAHSIDPPPAMRKRVEIVETALRRIAEAKPRPSTKKSGYYAPSVVEDLQRIARIALKETE